VSALAPLRCDGCGAAVPLPAAADLPASRACDHCGASVTLPAAYVAAAADAVALASARRAVEPSWRQAARAPAAWVGALALALLLLLPGAAALVAILVPTTPWPRLDVYSLAALPALVPGALLQLWFAAARTTVAAASAAAVAIRLDGARATAGCRQCGAPLAVDAGALAATCGYCGTDSVLTGAPLARRAGALARGRASLAELVAALRRRRRWLAAGTLATAIVLGGLAVGLALAGRA
jgi:hypothetical protein